jgi:predicted metal-binding membrane protein
MTARVPHTPVLNAVLRHDRVIVALLALLVVILSWVWLLNGAGTMEEMGGMAMPMSSGPWTLPHAALMFSMWVVMMAAMMMPSAMPMVLFYTTIARGVRARGSKTSSALVFAGGYVAVWTAFSIVATALQFALEKSALLSPMMESASAALSGALLAAAGIYQWMPVKQACLARCRSPLEFMLMQWRPGTRGAFVMGVRHGIYCVGCCWALMLLLFVGGVMNMAWIAVLAAFIFLEKILPHGRWTGRIAGVILIAWGAAVLIRQLA